MAKSADDNHERDKHRPTSPEAGEAPTDLHKVLGALADDEWRTLEEIAGVADLPPQAVDQVLNTYASRFTWRPRRDPEGALETREYQVQAERRLDTLLRAAIELVADIPVLGLPARAYLERQKQPQERDRTRKIAETHAMVGDVLAGRGRSQPRQAPTTDDKRRSTYLRHFTTSPESTSPAPALTERPRGA